MNLNDLHLFVEQVVEQELDELAIQPAEADAKGLALSVTATVNSKLIVLYDPKELTGYLQGSHEDDEEPEYGSNQPASYERVVVGMIQVRRLTTCRAWQVSYSAAKKGYGPMMYDIAMSVVHPEGIMSDRELVSNQARNVWRYMMTNRANQFNITQLPATRECSFKDENGYGKDPTLNYSFAIKSPINTDALEDRSAHAINQISDNRSLSARAIENELGDMADMFFRGVYAG